jgi:hypothetical protein
MLKYVFAATLLFTTHPGPSAAQEPLFRPVKNLNTLRKTVGTALHNMNLRRRQYRQMRARLKSNYKTWKRQGKLEQKQTGMTSTATRQRIEAYGGTLAQLRRATCDKAAGYAGVGLVGALWLSVAPPPTPPLVPGLAAVGPTYLMFRGQEKEAQAIKQAERLGVTIGSNLLEFANRMDRMSRR